MRRIEHCGPKGYSAHALCPVSFAVPCVPSDVRFSYGLCSQATMRMRLKELEIEAELAKERNPTPLSDRVTDAKAAWDSLLNYAGTAGYCSRHLISKVIKCDVMLVTVLRNLQITRGSINKMFILSYFDADECATLSSGPVRDVIGGEAHRYLTF